MLKRQHSAFPIKEAYTTSAMGLWHILAQCCWMFLVIPSKYPASAYPWSGWFYIESAWQLSIKESRTDVPNSYTFFVLLTGNDGRFRLGGFHFLQLRWDLMCIFKARAHQNHGNSNQNNPSLPSDVERKGLSTVVRHRQSRRKTKARFQ